MGCFGERVGRKAKSRVRSYGTCTHAPRRVRAHTHTHMHTHACQREEARRIQELVGLATEVEAEDRQVVVMRVCVHVHVHECTEERVFYFTHMSQTNITRFTCHVSRWSETNTDIHPKT